MVKWPLSQSWSRSRSWSWSPVRVTVMVTDTVTVARRILLIFPFGRSESHESNLGMAPDWQSIRLALSTAYSNAVCTTSQECLRRPFQRFSRLEGSDDLLKPRELLRYVDRLRGIMTVEPVEGLRAADTSALCGACAGILGESGCRIGCSFSFRIAKINIP